MALLPGNAGQVHMGQGEGQVGEKEALTPRHSPQDPERRIVLDTGTKKQASRPVDFLFRLVKKYPRSVKEQKCGPRKAQAGPKDRLFKEL
jgi:hypothetical protein